MILDSSADSEKEEDMVEWLREVGMPADYVNKLARMFQDIKVYAEPVGANVSHCFCSEQRIKLFTLNGISRSAKT